VGAKVIIFNFKQTKITYFLKILFFLHFFSMNIRILSVMQWCTYPIKYYFCHK